MAPTASELSKDLNKVPLLLQNLDHGKDFSKERNFASYIVTFFSESLFIKPNLTLSCNQLGA